MIYGSIKLCGSSILPMKITWSLHLCNPLAVVKKNQGNTFPVPCWVMTFSTGFCINHFTPVKSFHKRNFASISRYVIWKCIELFFISFYQFFFSGILSCSQLFVICQSLHWRWPVKSMRSAGGFIMILKRQRNWEH